MSRTGGDKIKKPKKRSPAKSLIHQSTYVSRPMEDKRRKAKEKALDQEITDGSV